MTEAEHLLSFSEVAVQMGAQHFSMAGVMNRIGKITDNDTVCEQLSFELLERRKLLREFKTVLAGSPERDVSGISSGDIKDIRFANRVITALTVSDLSVQDNVTELQKFVIALLRDGGYRPERIKKDCTLLLSGNKPDNFQDMLALGIMTAQVSAHDALPLFSRDRSLFTMIHSDDAKRMMAEIENELSSVNIYDIVDVIYEIAKKKSLSEFVRTRSHDIAVGAFSDFFVRTLGYEIFDYEKYLDDAGECVAKLEEVIT